MAGNDGSVAETEQFASSLACKEGPVLSVISKRLRSLKKKYNKILQIEESKAQGKIINREQEEVLKTKIAVAVLMDEYEKLRQPLLVAVEEEIAEREKELMAATLRRDDGEEGSTVAEEKDAEAEEVSKQKALAEAHKDSELQDSAVCSSENPSHRPEPRTENPNPILESELLHGTSHGHHHHERASNGAAARDIVDLLTFLYFAQLFDARSHGETYSLSWTKIHERSSCLSYDFVTEDSASPLLETDLDDLSLFGLLLTSRPPNATLSHRDAIQHCIEHANLWLQNSDALIREDLDLTYSHLRERLNRILSSEYFTMIPELQTVSQQTAAAAATATGQYASQLLIHEGSIGDGLLQSEDAPVYFSLQEQATAQQLPFQSREHFIAQPMTGNATSEASGADSTVNSSETSTGDEILKVRAQETPGDRGSFPDGVQQEQDIAASADPSQPEELQEPQEQQEQSHVPNVSVGPRGYQSSKGGGRVYNHGTGGRGRGYTNGRSGRGGRSGYRNGRGGQFYDQGGYYPRNYYGRGGIGRGMRGGSSTYNGYMNGQAPRATG